MTDKHSLFAGVPSTIARGDSHRRPPCLLAFLLLLTHAGPALAQTGTVSGTVTDAGTGLGLSRQVNVHDSSGALVIAVVSNASTGVYTASGLAPGSYYVRALGFLTHVDQVYDEIDCPTPSCPITSGTLVTVVAGGDTGGIDFPLNLSGSITGTITNAVTGNPVNPGVTVGAYTDTGAFVKTGTSDASGAFTIDGLAAGRYRVRTFVADMFNELYDDIPCSPSCNIASGTPISVVAGSTTSGIVFSLDPIQSISGIVLDALTGLPVANLNVDIFASDFTPITTATTNASGIYTASGLTTGSYKVRTHATFPFYVDEIYPDISCDVGCPLSAGQDVAVAGSTSGIDFALVPSDAQVRVLYLRPTDRAFRPDYYKAVQNAIYDLRAWYEEQMGGATFSLATARPEICDLPNPAGYYPGDARTRVTQDVIRCAPVGGGLTRSKWVLYADVEDACNDLSRLGVGGLGITWLGSGDLNGLIGAPVFDGCGVQYVFPVGRYIGGLGHEIGHAFGLPHPPGCDAGQPQCDYGALMWSGYASYPNTYLRTDEKASLNLSAAFRINTLVQNGHFSLDTTGWQFFAAPSPLDIVGGVTSGVLEFYRQAPPAGTSNQAVVLQPTGAAVDADTGLLAQFDLGNSSSVRKRIAVLVHDFDFSDLTFCTFWLPPNSPLQHYSMRTHTNQAWTNATVSFYAATTKSDGGYYRVDDVSLGLDPILNTKRTECVDSAAPTASSSPDGPELIANGGFDGGSTSGWSQYGQLVWQLTNGVFEFLRPAATPDPAGVVFQPTNTALAADEMLAARFDLGNSSGVRKRVTVLLHDLDFSDLSACTFYLEPGQALVTYRMRAFSTKVWTNATISIYAASAGDDAWIQLDNVSLHSAPGTWSAGTDCLEPGG